MPWNNPNQINERQYLVRWLELEFGERILELLDARDLSNLRATSTAVYDVRQLEDAWMAAFNRCREQEEWQLYTIGFSSYMLAEGVTAGWV